MLVFLRLGGLLAGLLLGGPVAAPSSAPLTPKATVYVFLSNTCPISQAVTLPLRQLHAQYGGQGVQFVGVFPEVQVRAAEVAAFRKQYQVPFPLRLDAGQALTRRFRARITPEVVVTAPGGRVLYQGRIDDSYVRLGQRRTVVQHQDLRDALAAIVAGQPVAQPRTEAVGCLIN